MALSEVKVSLTTKKVSGAINEVGFILGVPKILNDIGTEFMASQEMPG